MGRTSRVGSVRPAGARTRSRFQRSPVVQGERERAAQRTSGTEAVNERGENVRVTDTELRNAILGRLGYLEANSEHRFSVDSGTFRGRLRYEVGADALNRVVDQMVRDGILDRGGSRDFRLTENAVQRALSVYNRDKDLYARASDLRAGNITQARLERERREREQREQRLAQMGFRGDEWTRAFNNGVRDFVGKVFDKGGRISPRDLKGAFLNNKQDGVGGSVSVSASGNTMNVSANITRGGKDSSMSRTISFDSQGNLKVYHASWFNSSGQTGAGLGSRVAKTQYNLYRKMGVKRVGVSADGTVGRYLWASQGFDFKNSGELGSKRTAFVNYLRQQGVTNQRTLNKASRLNHAWEFAHFRVRGYNGGRNYGDKIGKRFLINAASDWSGSMNLGDRSSPSYKANRNYTSHYDPNKKGYKRGKKAYGEYLGDMS